MTKAVKPRINVKKLNDTIRECCGALSPSEVYRADRLVKSLLEGAPSYQKSSLPSCSVNNAPSAYQYGEAVTDAIAYWIKNGFVCGPFDSPPFDRFRVNSLMAIPQEGKVRPVINVSNPKNFSFNDNLIVNSMEKVHMSSARSFGYTLKKCGKGAIFSKFDMRDAYKNVPCQFNDLRLQGFKWLGKYFYETAQMFGARPAVPNYDILGNTVKCLTVCISKTPPELVHRHLDDVPNAGPKNSNICEKFSKTYKEVCTNLNILLAEDCPSKEKAFCNSNEGKVLGIWFDSKDLSWSMPKDKVQKILRNFFNALNSEVISVLEMQKLMGHLNNLSMMCPFLNGFRGNLNCDLGFSLSNNLDNVRLCEVSKSDLKVWAGCVLDTENTLPICTEPSAPTLSHKVFTSDAAGMADSMERPVRPAVATVGLDEEGRVMFAFRRFWDRDMIEFRKDRDGKRFGNKTAFLEFVGILIPFILVQKKLMNQHVVMKVDNISCVYAWENKFMKEDVYTSILVRALHLVSSYLCCTVHVEHLPRQTSWESKMVDRMSRNISTTKSDLDVLYSFEGDNLPNFFKDWLNKPCVDWSIPMKLLCYVKKVK